MRCHARYQNSRDFRFSSKALKRDLFQVLLGRIRLNSDKIGDSHTIHSLFLRTVHGQWGAWGIVEECRKPCSSTRNSIKRRFCDNPKPTYGGDYCVGDDTRSYPCPTEPCKCKFSLFLKSHSITKHFKFPGSIFESSGPF